MEQPDAQTNYKSKRELDSIFKVQVERLHKLNVCSRWLLVFLLWMTLAPLSLWGWRYEISLLRSHFTWAALRYGIIYNRLPAIGIATCIGMTASVLVWQSRNILWGMPLPERKRLEQRVRRICKQGPTHPLWKWICHR
ncbi:MAG: hypothetical protein F6K58_17820 [Symploca sp. SIO2E9]|nr:hypothetical protein [Symploca sp. SIO2E9]